jgi:hypothetical protein
MLKTRLLAMSMALAAVVGAQPVVRPAGPSVALTSPAAGEISGPATLSASASGAAAVQFELDGHPLGAPMTSPPYSLTWDTKTAANGPHALTAVALDEAGARAVSPPVRVAIKNPEKE